MPAAMLRSGRHPPTTTPKIPRRSHHSAPRLSKDRCPDSRRVVPIRAKLPRRKVTNEFVLRERTTAHSSHRAIEPPGTSIVRRQNFCRRALPRAVHVHAQFDLRVVVQRFRDNALNQFRVRRSDCVRQRN